MQRVLSQDAVPEASTAKSPQDGVGSLLVLLTIGRLVYIKP